MELPQFIELKRPAWETLQRLLDAAERRGLRALSLEEARQLSRLYRAASSDLLWVRARGGSADVSGFLNDLVGRAYALTYPGKPFRLSEIGAFLSRGFPDLMVREWRMYLAALLLFMAGGGFGWVGMLADPDAAMYLVPAEHQRLNPVERAQDEAQSAAPGAALPTAFSSFLFTHNIGVAILAFALGLTGGVGTALLLFANGVLLGALAWVYASKGLAGWFWAWILPHGIPEITAICLAGAAGLMVARGMVAPQGLPRRTAMRKEGLNAVKMLMGTLLLFVVAGCIEGTISQIHPPHLSIGAKIGFALGVGAAVYLYLLSGFLRARRTTA